MRSYLESAKYARAGRRSYLSGTGWRVEERDAIREREGSKWPVLGVFSAAIADVPKIEGVFLDRDDQH